MLSELPQEIRDVFHRYITTEYVTVDGSGQPIVWPVTPYYEDGAATVDVTTGIGYPKKADDAARHPRVALLFSDPTGSGISGAPHVLVQGTAAVDEDDLAANRERYRREAAEKLPVAAEKLPPKFIEGLFSWYFDRVYVKTTPERVLVWADGDTSKAPEVHGPALETPADAGDPGSEGGSDVWDARMEELGSRYHSAVLAWELPGGYPCAVRLPVATDSGARRILFGAVPAGLPMRTGRACVTAHSHSPEFSWQENFQVRGDLVRTNDGLALIPRKMVGGFELPKESAVAGLRRNYKKARRFAKIARERKRNRVTA
jgi:hypothetical protein